MDVCIEGDLLDMWMSTGSKWDTRWIGRSSCLNVCIEGSLPIPPQLHGKPHNKNNNDNSDDDDDDDDYKSSYLSRMTPFGIRMVSRSSW